MSLTLTLNNALASLKVNQQSLAVLSQNIANANTPGYSRQILNQQSVYLDGQGAGVTITDVTRKVDSYLVQSIQNQSSAVGQANVTSDYSDRVQILLGQPGANNSIDSDVTNFFNALSSLANSPESASLGVNAVNLGSTLASHISTLSSGLSTLQYQADQDIGTAIGNINTDLVQIKQLNESINANSTLGKSVADLQDKRDSFVKDLSQYMDIQTYTKTNGEMTITTGSGATLLDDNLFQLSYNQAGSADTFANNGTLAPLQINRVDDNGNPVGQPTNLVTSGTPTTVVSGVVSGQLRALLDMRDSTLPNIVSQLDTMTASLRDSVNAIHNAGSGYPGANSFTGTQMVNGSSYSQWSGSVVIAPLTSAGLPVAGNYPDESVTQPMTLDLSTLNTGTGTGQPSVQGIIKEINQYYAVQNKVEVGNLNNMRLVSDNTHLPTSPPQLNFDFDLQNLSATSSNMYVTGVSVVDNNGNSVGGVTSTIPSLSLQTDPSIGTYTTTAGSSLVTVHTTGGNTLKVGDQVYLSTPNTAVDGIPPTEFGTLFTVTSVNGNDFQVNLPTAAQNGGNYVVTQTALPKYTTVDPGTDARSQADGTFTADLSGNPTSPYYTVNVSVMVDDGNGNVKQSVVSYQVNNNDTNMLNNRYSASAATADGTIVAPNVGAQPAVVATLVDANGNELPKFNGQYTTTQNGYLKISSGTGNTFIAIDSGDSSQNGKPTGVPPEAGTGRGFSQYFGLNNFFVDTGDASKPNVQGAAKNLAVESRLVNNPNLISLGKLQPGAASSDPSKPNYTYQRSSGDNSIVSALANLGNVALSFSATGGLGQTSQTFAAYAAQIIGAAATNANSATTAQSTAQSLLDSYSTRSDSISGVNLDEELANTIIYQNAYSASARIITVVNSLFDTLIQSVTT